MRTPRPSARRVGRVIAAAFLALALVGLPSPLRAAPPAEDADLRYDPPPLADEENAYRRLDSAIAAIDWPLTKAEQVKAVGKGEVWDAALAADLLRRNETALAHLDGALACERALIPRDAAPHSTYDRIANISRLSTIAAVRVSARLEAGDGAGALEGALAIVRLGHLIAGAGGDSISYAFSLGIKQAGLRRVRGILARPCATSEVLKPAIARLAGLAPGTEAFAGTVRVEYELMCGLLDKAASGKFDDPVFKEIGFEIPQSIRESRFLDVPATRRMMAEVCRYAIKSAAVPFDEVDGEPLQRLAVEAPKKAKERADNAAGYVVCGTIMPNWKWLLATRARDAEEIEATRVLVAIRGYKLREGRLPPTLDALVPADLPGVPADPHDGKPLRYSPEAAAVYTAGAKIGNFTPDALRRAAEKGARGVYRIDF